MVKFFPLRGDEFYLEVIMPIYEYQCSKCNHEMEAIQKMSDEAS